MINLKYPLLLASKSPRRKELLGKLHIPFSVQTEEVDEIIPESIKPEKAALYLAKLKSEAHAHLALNCIVITSDTTVVLDGKILGKPSSTEEAYYMLKQLSGKTHQVITGICLRVNNEVHSFDVTTNVTFGNLSDAEINYYIETGSAFDKAGGYGIQDWIGLIGIEKIEGSYYNVMGLPVYKLYSELKQRFLSN